MSENMARRRASYGATIAGFKAPKSHGGINYPALTRTAALHRLSREAPELATQQEQPELWAKLEPLIGRANLPATDLADPRTDLFVSLQQTPTQKIKKEQKKTTKPSKTQTKTKKNETKTTNQRKG